MVEEPRIVAQLLVTTFVIALMVSAIGSISYFRFDEPIAGTIQAGLALANLVAIGVFLFTASIRASVAIAIAASLVTNTSVHLALGGFANSGGGVMWGITLTVLVSLVYGIRPAVLFGALVNTASRMESTGVRSKRRGREPSRPGSSRGQ